MHHVAVVLDLHQLVDGHAAVLADAAEVVAAQVDEHHVLGPLLFVGEQFGGDPAIVLGGLAARTRSGDRAGSDAAPVDGQQRLGARAGDLEVAEVQEVHVGARVDRAQTAVNREGLDRDGRGPALGGNDLEGVPGADVLDDSGDGRFEALARHVRLEAPGTRDAPAGRRAPPGTGPARRSRTEAIVRAASP